MHTMTTIYGDCHWAAKYKWTHWLSLDLYVWMWWIICTLCGTMSGGGAVRITRLYWSQWATAPGMVHVVVIYGLCWKCWAGKKQPLSRGNYMPSSNDQSIFVLDHFVLSILYFVMKNDFTVPRAVYHLLTINTLLDTSNTTDHSNRHLSICAHYSCLTFHVLPLISCAMQNCTKAKHCNYCIINSKTCTVILITINSHVTLLHITPVMFELIDVLFLYLNGMYPLTCHISHNWSNSMWVGKGILWHSR